jgi:hypothetical protein
VLTRYQNTIRIFQASNTSLLLQNATQCIRWIANHKTLQTNTPTYFYVLHKHLASWLGPKPRLELHNRTQCNMEHPNQTHLPEISSRSTNTRYISHSHAINHHMAPHKKTNRAAGEQRGGKRQARTSRRWRPPSPCSSDLTRGGHGGLHRAPALHQPEDMSMKITIWDMLAV